MKKLIFGLLLMFFIGCSENKDTDKTSTKPSVGEELQPETVFSLQSNDIVDGEALQSRFLHSLSDQCSGNNDFPHLSWSNIPEATQSFVVIVEDISAQQSSGKNWVHLNLYNIPSDTEEISTLTSSTTDLFPKVRFPTGTTGDNSWLGQNEVPSGWGGPCPPSGEHTYLFKVFALDMSVSLPSLNNVSVSEFETTHSQGILESASISVSAAAL